MERVLNKYSHDAVIQEYTKYPEMVIFTDSIKDDVYKEILDKNENTIGWSPRAVLEPHPTKEAEPTECPGFVNQREAEKLWKRVLGDPDNKRNPLDNSFIKRVENYARHESIQTRFGTQENPGVILVFDTPYNIKKRVDASINLLNGYEYFQQTYEIIGIYGNNKKGPKEQIKDAQRRAYNANKSWVIVITGLQCNMGVSIPECDIVVLMNNTKEFDTLHQMVFRCMTESPGKNVDLLLIQM